MKKTIFGIMLALLLTGTLVLAFNIQQTGCSEPPPIGWSRTYGGTNYDQAFCVVETGDGGYTLAGYTESFGAGGADFWLVKTDSNGNMIWNKTYGGTEDDLAECVVETGDGGYALAGNTKSFGAGHSDFWFVRTDSAGNMMWNKTYGGTGDDRSYSIVQTVDRGYALAGYTDSFGAGGWDFWLVKLAPVEISATVDIDPDTLNLKSEGEWITAYIELPEGYDVADINVSTILLNDTVLVDSDAPTAIGDYDDDGIPDLTVKFDRAMVISHILANVNTTKLYEERFMTITLTITGYLNDDTMFQGSDTIKIILCMPRGGPGRHIFPI